MFENECLCSLCAGIKSLSQPSCHISRLQYESQSCDEQLLAKFFHAATTVRSLLGLCQQPLSPSQDHHCECRWRGRALCSRFTREETRRHIIVKTVITELMKREEGDKSQLRDGARRLGERMRHTEKGLAWWEGSFCCAGTELSLGKSCSCFGLLTNDH